MHINDEVIYTSIKIQQWFSIEFIFFLCPSLSKELLFDCIQKSISI